MNCEVRLHHAYQYRPVGLLYAVVREQGSEADRQGQPPAGPSSRPARHEGIQADPQPTAATGVSGQAQAVAVPSHPREEAGGHPDLVGNGTP